MGYDLRRFVLGNRPGALTMAAALQDETQTNARFPRWDHDAGQTMVEYGFVLVAVALVAIGAFQAFGGRVSDLVNTVNIT